MTTGGQPPVETVQAYPVGQPLRPHRGALILVFGVLGLVCCIIFGIIAWVMGNSDLREMDAGRMDASGRGLTQAGKICGIISVALTILGIVISILLAMIGAFAGFRSA
ncbi:MAG: DUF4190 domain-containing protein [Sedimentisphaerales bacterium]|nr:DUF4190 domain-containing protein [Sedimentisphaerales bacterium]